MPKKHVKGKSKKKGAGKKSAAEIKAEGLANRAALREFVEQYCRDNREGALPSTGDEWAAVHAALKEGGSPLAELWTAGTLISTYSQAADERLQGGAECVHRL